MGCGAIQFILQITSFVYLNDEFLFYFNHIVLYDGCQYYRERKTNENGTPLYGRRYRG